MGLSCNYQGWTLDQGSPIPGPRTGTSLRPVRNRAAQQEVSGGIQQSFICRFPSLALPWTIPPITRITSLPNPLPPQPCLWKNCLPRNWSLVPKRLGTTALDERCTYNMFLKIALMVSSWYGEDIPLVLNYFYNCKWNLKPSSPCEPFLDTS